MNFHLFVRWSVIGGLVALLSGCMAAAIAPSVGLMAGTVSGTMDNSVLVTVDEKTVTPEILSVFATARSLAVVAGDRASVIAADVFESRGGYLVSVDRVTAKNGEMTGSERRDALRKLCVAPRPDIALLGRVTKSDTNNAMVAAFTGRAKVSQDWIMEGLVCRTNANFAFGGKIELDAGIYNNVQIKLEELIGAEVGAKILSAVGNAHSNKVAASAPSTTEGSSVNKRESSTSENLPTPVGESRAAPMTTLEVQQRLADLGYLRGKPDGILGRQTTDALRKFQTNNKITATGRLDNDTIGKLATTRRAP